VVYETYDMLKCLNQDIIKQNVTVTNPLIKIARRQSRPPESRPVRARASTDARDDSGRFKNYKMLLL